MLLWHQFVRSSDFRGVTRLQGDELLLSYADGLGGHLSSLATLERFAFSHGMAASGSYVLFKFSTIALNRVQP